MNKAQAVKWALDALKDEDYEVAEGDEEGYTALNILQEIAEGKGERHSTIPFEMAAGLAPPNKVWHINYATAMQQISAMAQWLEDQSHPPEDWDEGANGIWDCGDLGDFVEMFSTYMSFRPPTHPEIENNVREELMKG